MKLKSTKYQCNLTAQVYDPQLVDYLPNAYGTLPFSKKIGSREAAQTPLLTWETNVGFESLLTPALLIGSALFGGYDSSQVEVKLPAVLNKEEITVMLWFRNGDVSGRRTLIVSISNTK
jgi:hypothetical protein